MRTAIITLTLSLALVLTAALPALGAVCDPKEPAAAAWTSPWRGDPIARYVLGHIDSETSVRYVVSIRQDGQRVRRVKDVPAGCRFRTGWWRADGGSHVWVVAVFPDGTRTRLIERVVPPATKDHGRPYRGYTRGLDCSGRLVALAS